MSEKERIEAITKAVVRNFRCFGGGQGSAGNPIAIALKDQAACFAAGVNVKDVVRFVLQEAGRSNN